MGKEIIIFMVMIGCVIGITFGFFIPAIMAGDPVHEEEEVKEEIPVIASSNSTLSIPVAGDLCEGCHISGKNFIPQAYILKDHAEGGAYCLKCHKITHISHPVNENVTCIKCHGDIPKIPGSSDRFCDNCHAFPDALLPAYGSIIAVHRPRGVSCAACHINCDNCHEQDVAGEKWGKRINHFNTLLNAYK
ncbi:MAG TPA: hypothetical protein VN316_01710 [candidate division Zixibacteria bacterium]|nr:hypothetical protein [candidate division Zixibacteria bacterium]